MTNDGTLDSGVSEVPCEMFPAAPTSDAVTGTRKNHPAAPL